ncbi:MAG: Dabb family protein [Saprospiraceae bacterium]|nr:Dabb family protein [Saprospiraceae bacterium]MCB9325107.1 Dabb family protein [Lewinellaceae bacterium]
MKNILVLLIFLLLSLNACKQADLQQQLEACHAELLEKSQEQEILQIETPLVHTVYLKIREDISPENLAGLIEGVKTLNQIQGVKHLKTGTFENLGDERALAEYGLVLQMEFQSEADYRSYQQDSIHLAFKKNAGPLLAGPPATYDFIKK